MKIPVYLATLILMLLWGNVNSFAGTRPHSNYSLSLHNEQPQLIKFNGTVGASLTNISFPREDKAFICEDLEEEDTNDSSQGKFRSAVGFYNISPYQSCLYTIQNSAKVIPFLWRQVSCRYIMQRTLRI